MYGGARLKSRCWLPGFNFWINEGSYPDFMSSCLRRALKSLIQSWHKSTCILGSLLPVSFGAASSGEMLSKTLSSPLDFWIVILKNNTILFSFTVWVQSWKTCAWNLFWFHFLPTLHRFLLNSSKTFPPSTRLSTSLLWGLTGVYVNQTTSNFWLVKSFPTNRVVMCTWSPRHSANFCI